MAPNTLFANSILFWFSTNIIIQSTMSTGYVSVNCNRAVLACVHVSV